MPGTFGSTIVAEAWSAGALNGFAFANPLIYAVQIVLIIVLVLLFAFVGGYSFIGSAIAAYLLQGALVMFAFVFIGGKVAGYIGV